MSSRSKSQKISYNEIPNTPALPNSQNMEQANRGSRPAEIPIDKVLIKSGQETQRISMPERNNKKIY
jgi:hypothetical protein